MRVLGDGRERARWVAEAARLGLAERVRFEGRLPFAEAVAAMHGADLFCFTSLRDTSGNVVLEALAAGVPVMCFDHQGAGDMVNEASGWKLPVHTPARAYRDWAAALTEAARDPALLLAKSCAATERARAFQWDSNGDRVNAMYGELTARNKSRQNGPEEMTVATP